MTQFKRLLNRQEEHAYGELQRVADDHGYLVCVKVRVADVLPIEDSGISDDHYSYALRAHFDFVACDPQYNPVFAVEFDGPTHRLVAQQARDRTKDELCKRFDFPILRINTNHLVQKYNKASLLRWIISAWDLQKSFDEAQEKGQIPWDEGFDPIMLWHSGETTEEVHPHWLSLKPRDHIRRLHKRGTLPSPHTCQFVFSDERDTYRGIEWIDVKDGATVYVESAMRSQLFPLYLGDLFSELMTVQLYDKLLQYLKLGSGAVPPAEVTDRVGDLKTKYRFAFGHSGPSQVKFTLALVSGKLV